MREIEQTLLAMLLCLLITGMAGADNDSLRVHLNGGGSVSYCLDDIHKITFALTGVSEEALIRIGKPLKALLLIQNRPNPFQASSTIDYQLPKACKVKLGIYNLNGQMVRTLVDGEQQAGNHRVSWDGRNARGQKVANGMYLYQLESEGRTLSKKMLLVR